MRWLRIGFWICFLVNAMCLVAIGEQYGRLACWLAATVSFVAYSAAMLAAALNEQRRQERIRDQTLAARAQMRETINNMAPFERRRPFSITDPREHFDR